MITKALRWLSGLDRSYFFAVSSVISATIISVVVGILVALNPPDEATDGVDALLIIVLLALPVLVVATPLISLPQRTTVIRGNHKVNGAAATLILLAYVVVSVGLFGLFYVPALIFSVASTVSLFFGRRAVPDDAGPPVGRLQSGGDGEIRMSRSARRRAREEERIAADGGETPADPSPLESSRRRRGRRRRKS